MMAHYLALFLIGFLGSDHCVAMCGGFSLLLGSGMKNRKLLDLRYTLYQSGKALAYRFLGALRIKNFEFRNLGIVLEIKTPTLSSNE